MKTLQVLTVLAASAVLSTGAFAGSSSTTTTTVSVPVIEVVTSDATAKGFGFALGVGKDSYANQTIATASTPTLAESAVTTTALGGKSAVLSGKATSALTTNQLLIAGY